MKRCPECEFLYEDEQERCDMDATVLKSTTFLPPPTPSRQITTPKLKSISSGLTIPLIALVVIATVLVILYRATPPTFSSSSGLKKNSVPVTNQGTQPPASDSPEVVPVPPVAPEPEEPSPASGTRTRNSTARSNRSVPSTNGKPIEFAPALHVPVESAASTGNSKPATSQTSPAPAAIQKPAASSYTISIHPEPPPARTGPQSKSPDQDKDSKVKSFFKKAGRMLKKPF